MWPEPLTATATQTRRGLFVVGVHAGDGQLVANVTCAIDTQSKCGIFGEMRTLDRNGGPRQTVRALALLTREALRYAGEQGIAHVWTEIPDSAPLRAFAERIAGRRIDEQGRMAGDLAEIRSNALDVTDESGDDRAAVAT
jgi:hypothetical protein